MENPQISVIKKVLNNEYAQVMGIIGCCWFFVMNVILPIANIDSQLASIQITLADTKITNISLDARITQNSNDIIKLQQQIGY